MFPVLLAGLVATSTAERDFVPLFSWSDQSYLSKNTAANVASVDEVVSAFGKVLSQETRPEVVVAVVYDKLGSTTAFRANGAYGQKHPELAGSAMSEMETTLSGAVSSLSVPYLSVDQASVSSAVTSLFAEGSVHQTTQCEEAVEMLSGVLNNGVTDLVLLSVQTQPGLTVECLNALTRAAKNYIAIVSADHSDRRIVTEFPQPVAGLKGANRKLLSTVQAELYLWPGPQYILPNILLGLFFMFGFIFVVLVGVCCLMQIQTPIRFPHTNLRPPKEY